MTKIANFNVVIDLLLGAVLVRLQKIRCLLTGEPNLSKVTDRIYVGGANSISVVAKRGISAVLDLRAEQKNEKIVSASEHIEYLRINIKDKEPPSLDQLREAVSWIDSKLNNDRTILIQCNLGRGRSATIACGYLISIGIPLPRALTLMKQSRRVTFINSKQLQVLKEFEEQRNRALQRDLAQRAFEEDDAHSKR